jgi:hypothetical protein
LGGEVMEVLFTCKEMDARSSRDLMIVKMSMNNQEFKKNLYYALSANRWALDYAENIVKKLKEKEIDV